MKYIKKFEESEDKSLITDLFLSGQNLIELPDLSEYTNLTQLNCANNNLTYLPELPDTLIYLNCRNNRLTYLPKLPKTLELIHCSINKLISLPELPKRLIKLFCYDNELTSLPELPNTLKELYCYDNELTSLPELPDTLKDLYCDNSGLPFDDFISYKKWYQKNKNLIDKIGLKEVYELLHDTNKYNL